MTTSLNNIAGTHQSVTKKIVYIARQKNKLAMAKLFRSIIVLCRLLYSRSPESNQTMKLTLMSYFCHWREASKRRACSCQTEQSREEGCAITRKKIIMTASGARNRKAGWRKSPLIEYENRLVNLNSGLHQAFPKPPATIEIAV